MVFSSIPFLFYYLPALLLVYYIVPASSRALRNLVLVVASLLFYAWGEGLYVLLLLVSIVVNHSIAQWLQRGSTGVLIVGVLANLLFLGWYKYAGFVFSVLGVQPWQVPSLPLGISFFTFQAISYLIDVYRKEAQAAESILTSALYISSFPQLIAGPIVRYKTVAQQIVQRSESLSMFSQGISAFVIGLAQKVLLANVMAEAADAAFNADAAVLGMASAWLGLLAYGLQIFFDFAGYSNMAIGLGLMLGFRFPINFNTPYAAQSVTLFWRRWHMTLSEWFRDYLYIGLGGNRYGTLRTIINLWVVFLLCGLWHGAAWSFVAWGAWHGAFLSIERLGLSNLLSRLWQPLRHVYLLLVVFLAWVLFRADDLAHAIDYYHALFGLNHAATEIIPYVQNPQYLAFTVFALLLSTGAGQKVWQAVAGMLSKRLGKEGDLALSSNAGVLSFGVAHWFLIFTMLILAAAALTGGAYNPFIYFRF